MRKIFFLLLTATFLWSCQNQNFTIQGTVDNAFDGTYAYLQEITETGEQRTLQTALIQNGTFTFTGVADNTLVVVSLGEMPDPQNTVPVILESGTIRITFGEETSVAGTRINTLFHEFRTEQLKISEKMMSIAQRFYEKHVAGTLTDELANEIRAEHAKVSEELQELNVRFIRNNIDNAAGRWLLRVTINNLSLEIQEELLALTDDSFRAKADIARIIARIESAQKVAVGQKFTNFTLPNPEGEEVSLSDFAGQGNYTLVVFWATWCGPCIQSIPQLREIYARYQNRGFEMVGVSFDRDHDALVNGIREYNITWPQMVDLNRANSTWDLYAIRGIPHTVLLNREGYIIANSLRGEALDNKLAELMP